MSAAFAGRQALVVGLGRSGQAAARILLAHGARVRAVDAAPGAGEGDEADALRAAGVAIECGPHRSGQGAGCDLVALSPGVPPGVLPVVEALAAGVEVLGEMELGARLARGRLFGITGSNGKSTTTSLAARMMQAGGLPARAGGNLGTPLCALLLERNDERDVHCLEVSSFQAETLGPDRFEAAALLNISPDHLDRYPDLAAYEEAKLKLLDAVGAAGLTVLNADDPRSGRAALRAGGRVAWFGLEALPGDGIALRGERVVRVAGGRQVDDLFGRDDLWTRAPHHLANAMAAAAIALEAGAPTAAIAAGLRGFAGLPHRGEIFSAGSGPRFVNDSKATNVDAAVHAIDGSEPGTVVILGGRHKGGDLSPLREALQARACRVVLIGEAADVFEESLRGAAPMTRAADFGEAVRVAAAQAGPGGTVLLAPACASFDMFSNYEHRGERFKEEAGRHFGDARLFTDAAGDGDASAAPVGSPSHQGGMP